MKGLGFKRFKGLGFKPEGVSSLTFAHGSPGIRSQCPVEFGFRV